MFHTVLASLANVPERPGAGHGHSEVHEGGGHAHYVGPAGTVGHGGGSDQWWVIVLFVAGTAAIILVSVLLARKETRKSPSEGK